MYCPLDHQKLHYEILEYEISRKVNKVYKYSNPAFLQECFLYYGQDNVECLPRGCLYESECV